MLAEIFRDPPMAPGKQADIRHVTISRRQLPGDGGWVGRGNVSVSGRARPGVIK
jgi:hypothetical protein